MSTKTMLQTQDVDEVLVAIIKEREETRQEIAETEPDTPKEARLWGKLRGLDSALSKLEGLNDWDLPEWQIGVENDAGDWEWYHPRTTTRENAKAQAREQARDDLGGSVSVYEIGGPVAP